MNMLKTTFISKVYHTYSISYVKFQMINKPNKFLFLYEFSILDHLLSKSTFSSPTYDFTFEIFSGVFSSMTTCGPPDELELKVVVVFRFYISSLCSSKLPRLRIIMGCYNT